MFTCNLLVRMLFGILVIFMVQGDAAPISSLSHDNSSDLAPSSDSPSSSIDTLYFTEHRSKVHAGSEAAVGVAQPLQSFKDKQVSGINAPAGNAHTDNRAFMETHPALVIGLFILVLFILCVSLYAIFRYYRNKIRTSQVMKDANWVETAECSFEDKDPVTPASGETNTIYGEPLPECPQLIYVPPSAEGGAQTIFGHFVSPCGRVLGVKDTWTLAGSRRETNSA